MKRNVIWISTCLTIIMMFVFPLAIKPSDHADPMILGEPDSNITGLFFFPKGDQMILILNFRRALRAPKPYELSPFEYEVSMDLHSQVSFDNEEDRARYGGTIVNPEGLKADVKIKFQLNDDTTAKAGFPVFEGLKNPESIRTLTGVRDDPFIFPRFFDRNVISLVLSIPISSFPEGQKDWIIWGTTYEHGKQVDHVGRSNRTQLGRFDALNTLPPDKHIAKIKELQAFWDGWWKFFDGYNETQPIAGLIQYVLQIRKYDFVTDVMIYTDRYPPGFPNGRQLEDDIAAITCATGDCILQEISFIEGKTWPRQTVNDKQFLGEFPYIAEPWPDDAAKHRPKAGSILPLAIGLGLLGLIVFMAASWGIVELLRLLVRRILGHFRIRSKEKAEDEEAVADESS